MAVSNAPLATGIYGRSRRAMWFRPQGLIPESGSSSSIPVSMTSRSMDVRGGPEEEEWPTFSSRSRCCGRSSVAVAVNDVDFTITGARSEPDRAEWCGKTTLQHDHGVDKPLRADLFEGEDIAGMPPHAATERGIGRMFQNIRLFQQMMSLQNVLVGMHCRLSGGIIGRFCGCRRSGEKSVRRANVVSNCSTTAAWRACTMTYAGTSPTAISGGSRWHARSRRNPSSSSSTSRRPG